MIFQTIYKVKIKDNFPFWSKTRGEYAGDFYLPRTILDEVIENKHYSVSVAKELYKGIYLGNGKSILFYKAMPKFWDKETKRWVTQLFPFIYKSSLFGEKDKIHLLSNKGVKRRAKFFPINKLNYQ